MREASSTEVWRYVATWADEPPVAVVIRAALGVKPPEAEAQNDTHTPRKTELTQAEYDEMVAGMKANAEMYGRRRN